MIRGGQLVLLSFPQTDQTVGRLRPTLVLRRLPGPYDDWLVCMISSHLRHEVSADILHGTIGKLNEERLTPIRTRVANWILGASGTSEEEATKAEQAEPHDK